MMLEIIVLLLAVPVGYLIAYLANDELVAGRKWFRGLMIVSVLVGGWFGLAGNYSVAWTCGFVLIVAFISYVKSFDGVWCKRRID